MSLGNRRYDHGIDHLRSFGERPITRITVGEIRERAKDREREGERAREDSGLSLDYYYHVYTVIIISPCILTIPGERQLIFLDTDSLLVTPSLLKY